MVRLLCLALILMTSVAYGDSCRLQFGPVIDETALGLNPIERAIRGFQGRDRVNDFWRASGRVSIENRKWMFRYQVGSEVRSVEVAFWSTNGNPVLLFQGQGRPLLLRPTQPSVPNHMQHVNRSLTLTEATREAPVRTFLFEEPNGSDSLVVEDGHHRVVRGIQTGSVFYVEIYRIRAPFSHEVIEGRWDTSPLF